jgi:ABC-type multidrug transport system fused ATPase/permease subunit
MIVEEQNLIQTTLSNSADDIAVLNETCLKAIERRNRWEDDLKCTLLPAVENLTAQKTALITKIAALAREVETIRQQRNDTITRAEDLHSQIQELGQQETFAQATIMSTTATILRLDSIVASLQSDTQATNKRLALCKKDSALLDLEIETLNFFITDLHLKQKSVLDEASEKQQQVVLAGEHFLQLNLLAEKKADAIRQLRESSNAYEQNILKMQLSISKLSSEIDLKEMLLKKEQMKQELLLNEMEDLQIKLDGASNVASLRHKDLEFVGTQIEYVSKKLGLLKLRDNPWSWRTSTKRTNILVIGETGAGKSTFINIATSFFRKGSVRCPEKTMSIPTLHHLSVGGKHTENDLTRTSISSTSGVTNYTFRDDQSGAEVVIIDTPGLGDTRGLEQDDANIRLVLKAGENLDDLSAVIVVINGMYPRFTAVSHKLNIYKLYLIYSILYCRLSEIVWSN